MTNDVTILTGIPGVGKTREIDQLLRNNPDKKKIYLITSHDQLSEREDFLKGVEVTHWFGMKLICPKKHEEPIKTMVEVGAPTRWICRLCQSMKLISPDDCPHKTQFQNPANIVIAPATYLFTEHVKKYDPDLIVVDDVILRKQDLPHLSTIRNYIHQLYSLGFCDYDTLEELFDLGGSDLKRYILSTIEPRLKAGLNRLLKERSELSKETARIVLLKVDPMELLDWCRLVKVYGWQEEFSIPLLMPIFELSLENDREVIVVGAQINKLFLEMLAKCFQRECGEPIRLNYRRIELDQPSAKSVVYRVRSPKYSGAWYPTTTSVTKNRREREIIKQRIETILLSVVKEPSELSDLTVGVVKPKNANMTDFLTTLVEHYPRIMSLDFGNLRGSNQLENCDILIVIGTYKVNIEDLVKDFERFYHRKSWTTKSEKLFDGGYKYTDSELENFRRMVEEYEMYQAIHRVRPALRQKRIFVFGLIPHEIREEFEVKDLTFEKDEMGVMCLVEWESFDKFVREKIAETGIFHGDLVKAISVEFDLSKEATRQRIRKFVSNHSDEYEITEKTIGDRKFKYVQRRR